MDIEENCFVKGVVAKVNAFGVNVGVYVNHQVEQPLVKEGNYGVVLTCFVVKEPVL